MPLNHKKKRVGKNSNHWWYCLASQAKKKWSSMTNESWRAATPKRIWIGSFGIIIQAKYVLCLEVWDHETWSYFGTIIASMTMKKQWQSWRHNMCKNIIYCLGKYCFVYLFGLFVLFICFVYLFCLFVLFICLVCLFNVFFFSKKAPRIISNQLIKTWAFLFKTNVKIGLWS